MFQKVKFIPITRIKTFLEGGNFLGGTNSEGVEFFDLPKC